MTNDLEFFEKKEQDFFAKFSFQLPPFNSMQILCHDKLPNII